MTQIKYDVYKQQQLGREEIKQCRVCGTTLLKYVDFNDQTRNRQVCVNCNKLDLKSKEIVNASPIFSKEQYISKEDQQIQDTKPQIFYNSEGKPLNEKMQVLYNLDYQIVENNKTITKQEVIDQLKLIPTQIEENKANLPNTIVQNKIATNPIDVNKKIIINWEKVIGYEDIKALISSAINSKYKKRVHVLLVGAPGTSKTVFLQTIQESLQKQSIDVHYLDATTLTSSGVINYLFMHDNIRYCLIDELDKLSREHQATFLNTFETGILQETKGSIGKDKTKSIRRKDMSGCTFICTANYEDKILPPLKTRMLTLRIKEYTKEQFYQIGEELLVKQYSKTKEIAKYIVDAIYKIYTEKRHEKPNLRYCRDVAILTDNNKATVDPIIKAITEHSISYEE